MTILRNALKSMGVVGLLVFLAGFSRSTVLMSLSIIAVFLGMTDFGRQCPLFLSLRHLLYRIKSEKQPQRH